MDFFGRRGIELWRKKLGLSEDVPDDEVKKLARAEADRVSPYEGPDWIDDGRSVRRHFVEEVINKGGRIILKNGDAVLMIERD